MLLPLVGADDPVLRAPTGLLTRDEILSEEIQTLINDMKETMYACPGVGLAAPQIGRGIRLAVMQDTEELIATLPPGLAEERERVPFPFTVLINATIVEESSEKRTFFEGCLSIPGRTAAVPRAYSVRVRYWDERGEEHNETWTGWRARIAQHEIRHLEEGLYVDAMIPETEMATAELKALVESGSSLTEILASCGVTAPMSTRQL